MCNECNSTNVEFVRKGDDTGYTHKVLKCNDCEEEIAC